MPKQTFFNLPKDKKEKILRSALNEFTEKGFDQGSVNVIVVNADISKGSFYQYFEDKKDVFKHILSIAGDEKLKYINENLGDVSQMDFFDMFKKMYVLGIRFGLDHPEYYRITCDVLSDEKLIKEILGEQVDKRNGFFPTLLKDGIQNGSIRKDIDVVFISNMLIALSLSMTEHFVKEYGFENLEKLEDHSIMLIDFIKNGINGGNKNDQC